MRLVTKTARVLLFLIFLISPLYAAPDGEAEDTDLNDEVFFIEELFIFEETFDFGEFIADEESFPDEEPFLSDDPPPHDEPLLSEELFSEDALLLSEETYPDDNLLLSEEDLFPEDESLLAEEDLPNEGAFAFESPPLIFEVTPFEIRSIDAIFPNLSYGQRIALSNDGLRYYLLSNESPILIPNPDSGIDLLSSVMKKNPSHLIETLLLVPYNEKELDLLDIYNALGRIEKIKEQPFSYNDNDYYVFTESTRIVSSRNRKGIADPLPAEMLPFSETMYLRIKEFSFGNLFIRGDLSISMYGLTYTITNFTDIRYFLVPIMKAERFTSIIYLEPVKEGILIYSTSGFYLPGFIADRTNLTPNINIRINVLLNWIIAGLRTQQADVTADE